MPNELKKPPSQFANVEGAIVIPNENRKCTDSFGICLIIGFTVTLVALSVYCYMTGDVRRIKNGTDSCGNTCGLVNQDFRSKDDCPKDNKANKLVQYETSNQIVYNPNKIVRRCVKGCFSGFQQIMNKCVPDFGTDVANTIFTITGREDFFKEISEDLCAAWREIICLALIAMGLSICGLTVIYITTVPSLWFMMITALVMPSLCSFYGWTKWLTPSEEDEYDDNRKKLFNTYLVYGFLSFFTAVDSFVVILAIKGRLPLVSALYSAAGKTITGIPWMYFMPLLTFLAICISCSCSLYLGVLIESSGELTDDDDVSYFRKKPVTLIARYYNLVGLFWNVLVIINCQEMIVSGAVVSVYFNSKKRTGLNSPIKESAYNTFRYHLGSLIVISALSAIFKALQIITSKFEVHVLPSSNMLVKFLTKIFVRYMNKFKSKMVGLSKESFVEINMFGFNFLESRKGAMEIQNAHGKNLAATSTAGGFILFFIKASVVLVTDFVSVVLFKRMSGIQHLWVLLMLISFLSYAISHCFVDVYEMVINTLFICAAHDHKIFGEQENPNNINNPNAKLRLLIKKIEEEAEKTDDKDPPPVKQ